ncbi:MAG TPA: TatD family hydrolase [Marinagarivorans sp.]
MPFIDSHCHIDFSAFDADRLEVLSAAKNAGLHGLLVPGVVPMQWETLKALGIALRTRQPSVFFGYGVGLHPWWFTEWLVPVKETGLSCGLQELKNCLLDAAQAAHCCAIGETGLDALSANTCNIDLACQVAIVEAHIEVANQLQLPIILHCVKAHNELIRLLNATPVQHGGVVHGFTGSAQLAQEYWQRGLHIGVGGSITYERAHKTREAVKALPLEALLLETDSPDMPLCGRQGERNSPEYLPEVARALATLRGENYAQVVDACYQNTCDLFLKLTP